MKKNKKSQAIMLDLVLSISIFAIITTSLIIVWAIYQDRIQDNFQDSKLLNTAFAFSDFLISTEGQPTNWNNNTVTAIGLADSDRILSNSKLKNLSLIDYNQSKNLFKVSLLDYDYSLLITSIDKINTSIRYAYGVIAPNDARRVIKVSRLVIYQNETTIFQVSLWNK
jgi:hypothetical protein